MSASSLVVTARLLAVSLGWCAVVSVPAIAQSSPGVVSADSSAVHADSLRASALLANLGLALQGADRTTAVAAAEQDLARLDSIPGAIPQKLVGHNALQGYYSSFDIDDKLAVNARTILALAKQLPVLIQPRATRIVSGAYRNLASLQANELHPDSAVAILQAAPAAFPAIPTLKDRLTPDIARYQMVGHKAPPVYADYWLNRDSASPPVSWTNGVSVLVFTANWCHSCRDSYPTLTKLSADDASRGLHMVFAVSLDGQFEGTTMPPEQEVAANRQYYVTHHGFTAPIAIQQPASSSTTIPRNDQAFLVAALPQLIVIDRTGTIRAVLLGWDPYGRRQHALTTIVTQLLSSGPVAQAH